MSTCASCGDDQEPIHWRGYCHACCLHKPGYAIYLEAELKEYEQRAIQLWHVAAPDPTDDLAEDALCDFINWVDSQLENALAAEAEGGE